MLKSETQPLSEVGLWLPNSRSLYSIIARDYLSWCLLCGRSHMTLLNHLRGHHLSRMSARILDSRCHSTCTTAAAMRNNESLTASKSHPIGTDSLGWESFGFVRAAVIFHLRRMTRNYFSSPAEPPWSSW